MLKAMEALPHLQMDRRTSRFVALAEIAAAEALQVRSALCCRVQFSKRAAFGSELLTARAEGPSCLCKAGSKVDAD